MCVIGPLKSLSEMFFFLSIIHYFLGLYKSTVGNARQPKPNNITEIFSYTRMSQKVFFVKLRNVTIYLMREHGCM